MEVRVRLFALARQLAGYDVVTVEVPDAATVGVLRQRLAEQFPGLQDMITRTMFAVDSEYADDSVGINSESEIGCIPPVSGGSGGEASWWI